MSSEHTSFAEASQTLATLHRTLQDLMHVSIVNFHFHTIIKHLATFLSYSSYSIMYLRYMLISRTITSERCSSLISGELASVLGSGDHWASSLPW